MSTTSSENPDQRANAFDLIRLVAASFVLWSHQHALLGLPEPTIAILRTSFGGLGIWIFFAVSGYLNTHSVARHRSVLVFLWNRALRIYPALIVCVIFTVVLGLVFSTDLHAYFGPKLLSYVGKNTTLLFGVRTGVPGVFETNSFREALNGSLWSLPYEVKMYIVLVLCLAVARYNLYTPIVIFISAALLAALSAGGILPHLEEDSWQTLSTLFLAGSAVAAMYTFVGLPAAVGATTAVAALLAFVGAINVASELLITALVIAIGCLTLPKWLRPPLDISYGVYLYAFPVQQVSAVLFKNFWFALTFTCAITFLLATISALFIERYALNLKSKFNIAVWLNSLKRRRLDMPDHANSGRVKGSSPAG